MSLQMRVFRRVFVLLSVLITAVCVTAAVFSLREHREIVKNSFRAHALFLAEQVERLVLWDDRVSLRGLLTRLVDEQSVVAYAFVDKSGVPYVHTFQAGVPTALLDLRPKKMEVGPHTWSSETGVFYDIAAPLEQGEAILHIGLSREEVYIESLPKVWAIVSLGVVALLIGLFLSWFTSVVTTREVNAMTDALRINEERIRLLLSSAAEGVFGIDSNGRCTFMNPAAQRMLGYHGGEQVIGRDMRQLVHHTKADGTPRPPEECRIHESLRTGRPHHSDDEILWRSDGTSFPAELWAHPIEKDSMPVGAAVTFVDISERKEARAVRERLQEQLFDAQKMEALGQLAGGIAHDFNNLLSPIILIVEVLLDDLGPASEEAKHLADVLQAARRARQLVHQILSYSRPQEVEKVAVDMENVVRDVTGLIRPSLPEGVTLESSLKPDLPKVEGDSAEIHQLILNLVTNAMQAMEKTGGQLTIGLYRTSIAQPLSLSRGSLGAGDYVVLEVKDTGCGMTEDTRRRIFEPFFTTKKGSEGAGLGLAIVDRIVNGHEGVIEVTSRDGVGTTFTIRLPAIEPVSTGGDEISLIPA